ncbi:MAG: hypothetical protein ACOX10_00790 [Candidatus Methanomethylophilaceae archaeon]
MRHGRWDYQNRYGRVVETCDFRGGGGDDLIFQITFRKKVPGSAPSAVSISETAKRDENAATRAIANREALRTEDMDITLTTSPIITVRTRFRHFVQNVNLYEVDIDINIGLSKL